MRYYANQSVRSRIEEFLGLGRHNDEPACAFLTVGDSENMHFQERLSYRRLASTENDKVEISRSLWDRESLVADLDIEYVNFDLPAEPFLHPERAFFLQEPVRLAAESIFAESQLNPLHLLSGRGYHFVWQISQRSAAFEELAAMGQAACGRSKL